MAAAGTVFVKGTGKVMDAANIEQKKPITGVNFDEHIKRRRGDISFSINRISGMLLSIKA